MLLNYNLIITNRSSSQAIDQRYFYAIQINISFLLKHQF